VSHALPVAVDWFGLPPQAGARGRADGLAVALWRLDRDAPLAFRTAPMAGTHMVCAHLSGSIGWQARLDGRRYARPCLPGTACMARAGEAADVVLHNAHASFVHFYLPTSWFTERIEDLAPGVCASHVELLDPMNARAPEVGRCALAAARALRDGGVAAHLEVEAAALLLAAALIRHHSNAARRIRPLARGGLPLAAPRCLRGHGCGSGPGRRAAEPRRHGRLRRARTAPLLPGLQAEHRGAAAPLDGRTPRGADQSPAR